MVHTFTMVACYVDHLVCINSCGFSHKATYCKIFCEENVVYWILGTCSVHIKLTRYDNRICFLLEGMISLGNQFDAKMRHITYSPLGSFYNWSIGLMSWSLCTYILKTLLERLNNTRFIYQHYLLMFLFFPIFVLASNQVWLFHS